MNKLLVAGLIAGFSLVATTATAQQTITTTKSGDVLLMQQVQKEHGMVLPKRGMTMAQVERRFGAPTEKLAPRGGDSARHPVINRWVYPGYTVYFERTHVIHAVVNPPASNG